jgi:porphobilinogen synthase
MVQVFHYRVIGENVVLRQKESRDMSSPVRRPRRLRTTPAIRRLVAETRVHPAQLLLPVFVADGLTEPRPIGSLPGVVQHSLDSVRAEASRAVAAGIGGMVLFGVPDPDDKDASGSTGWAADGILNRAVAAVRAEVGDDLVVVADTCLDEFTDHGHCGVLADDGSVANDATVELYVRQAVSQAEAGAHLVSPSGMMDGQVAAIRAGLDLAGHEGVGILAYAVKYASAFYGPFREAVGSSLVGDRRAYQQDPANRREGRLEAALDELEGADILMVKPASHYLDVLADVATQASVPVAAYQVSGEYAMIAAAAERGWIDRQAALTEATSAIVRAGADIVLTYAALELAGWLR